MRESRPVSECPGPPAGGRAGGGDDQQRRLGPGLRPHLCEKRPGRSAGSGLDLQRLGRPVRRAVLSLGSGRPGGPEDLRAGGGGQLPHRRFCAGGRVHPCGRSGHCADHGDVPAVPGTEPGAEPPGYRGKALRLSGVRKGHLAAGRHRPRWTRRTPFIRRPRTPSAP